MAAWLQANGVLLRQNTKVTAVDPARASVTTEDGRTIEALGVTHPKSAGVIVPDYLERFKAKGQFAHYRG